MNNRIFAAQLKPFKSSISIGNIVVRRLINKTALLKNGKKLLYFRIGKTLDE